MATTQYKNPKYQPMEEAGKSNQKKFLKDTPFSVANARSDDYAGVKTSGIKIRGTGAATKGVMARGPMG